MQVDVCIYYYFLCLTAYTKMSGGNNRRPLGGLNEA